MSQTVIFLSNNAPQIHSFSLKFLHFKFSGSRCSVAFIESWFRAEGSLNQIFGRHSTENLRKWKVCTTFYGLLVASHNKEYGTFLNRFFASISCRGFFSRTCLGCGFRVALLLFGDCLAHFQPYLHLFSISANIAFKQTSPLVQKRESLKNHRLFSSAGLKNELLFSRW